MITARTKQASTTARDRPAIATTCGAAVTSGVTKATWASIAHNWLRVRTVNATSQATMPSSSQPAMTSCPQNLAKHVEQHRREQRQGVVLRAAPNRGLGWARNRGNGPRQATGDRRFPRQPGDSGCAPAGPGRVHPVDRNAWREHAPTARAPAPGWRTRPARSAVQKRPDPVAGVPTGLPDPSRARLASRVGPRLAARLEAGTEPGTPVGPTRQVRGGLTRCRNRPDATWGRSCFRGELGWGQHAGP